MGEIHVREQTPTRHRLDVGAYYKMAEAGILAREDRVELIDGLIFDVSAITPAHAGMRNRLIHMFWRAVVDSFALVSAASPLRLDLYNEPDPDLMLLKPRPDDYQTRHPEAADVLLLVEISESSLGYDRGTKLALYARFGVPEVWIVDLKSAPIEVYREPVGEAYGLKQRVASGSLAPALVPGAVIDVAAFFA